VVTVTFDMTFGFLSQFALCFDVVGSHTLNFHSSTRRANFQKKYRTNRAEKVDSEGRPVNGGLTRRNNDGQPRRLGDAAEL
jgi:hypothetical protein